jgi:transposase
MPPVPVIRSLYGEIARSININAKPSLRLHELENTAIEMLTHAAPRMLRIDEIQHLLSCTSREQRAALNAIKYLANQLRMTIVAAGTHEALQVMRFDAQIASRFESLWASIVARRLSDLVVVLAQAESENLCGP